ncbi:MAG: tRNA pseudouridine(55) synthase TruB, partial [Fusobacteriaceae bacterium]
MDGIICVNKPQGITSFDVVRKLKRILKEKRIGHTGTLDPMATGVMVVCVGRATRLVQDIEGYEKEYLATFQLGYKTDTYDREGTVTERSE